MIYAKVVLGIPVEGPFDYVVPASLCKTIKVGARVWVNFGNRKMLGYVVQITRKTQIKKLKTLLDVLDGSAVLNKNTLLLTKRLSEYYCCSWGEAIETALPDDLRKGKRIPDIIEKENHADKRNATDVTLIHDLQGQARWDIYLKSIEEELGNKNSVIFLLSDINSVLKTKEIIIARLGIQPLLLYRKKPKELQDWLKLKEGEVSIVVGTRSAIFAPVNNLGLVIIDEEQESAYKQDQVPHYHAREVAFMRIKIEKARLILTSTSPSLESLDLVRKNKIKHYTFIPQKSFPQIKIFDMNRGQYALNQKNILSKYLQDVIYAAVSAQDKILLFLNRRGFATFAYCRHCGYVLICPHCDVNLTYHFQDNVLNCYYCNFKMPPANICPNCNSGYIRYSGIGTEKIESELARLFPQTRIKRLEKIDKICPSEADIFISAKSILKQAGLAFDLVMALAIDNSLGQIDFRAAEKTFGLLLGLSGLAKKTFIIQTGLFRHHCFQALIQKDTNIFYNEELRQRRELQLPPFSHLCLVKLRGKNEARVKEISNALFNVLNKDSNTRTIKIISVNPALRHKLRDKFCWQILIKGDSAPKITKFLKKSLTDFSHSGIIVTVDMDPL